MFEMFGKKLPENWVDPDPLDMTWEHQKEEYNCECWYDPETGFFEACSKKHEQEYLDYLKTLHSASENSACHPESPADHQDQNNSDTDQPSV